MYVVVLVTVSGKKEADKIARGLLKDKLAACVNIIGSIKSLFWWKGKIDQADEALLVIKTRRPKLPKLIKKVKSLHGYDVPEIIALPIILGDSKYLEWISESTR